MRRDEVNKIQRLQFSLRIDSTGASHKSGTKKSRISCDMSNESYYFPLSTDA